MEQQWNYTDGKNRSTQENPVKMPLCLP